MNRQMETLLEDLDLADVVTVDATTPLSSIAVDSLRVVELVGRLEDELAVEVPDELLAALVTVGDLRRLLEVRSDG